MLHEWIVVELRASAIVVMDDVNDDNDHDHGPWP